MYPTLLDTKTGKTVEAKDGDSSLFWWAEGNGSCDCNRVIFLDEAVYDELTKTHGDGNCFGSERILAIDVHGDLNGMSKEYVLEQMNQDYPKELLEKHITAS